jgi:hypothetical protein
MGIKANKSNGYKAEAEAADISQGWPRYKMFRTGLDGKHDLSGLESVGEVKAVRAGPIWLKDALAQLDNCTDDRLKIGMVKLSRRHGARTGWVVFLDLDQWEHVIGN